MLTSLRARLAASVVVSAGFVLLGHVFAGRATAELGYDSTFYVAMVSGRDAAVPGPFKFRVLVPFLASLLPTSPRSALLLISYLSLFGVYLFVIRACRTLGLGIADAAFGVLAIWGSTWHLYHYYNPYMTDAFALLALSVMVAALLTETFWPFVIAGVIGVLGRETTAFLAPAWFATRQVGRTVVLIAMASVLVWLPRYWLGDGDLTIASAFTSSGTSFMPAVFIRQLAAFWGFVWFLALAGAWYLPRQYVGRLAAAFCALLLSAIAASTIATDAGRMFAFLAPVLAIGAAQFYAVVRRRSSTLAWVLVGLIALQGFFNTPEAMFDSQAWIVGWPRRAFLVAELSLGILIVAKLRAGGAVDSSTS